MGKSIILMGFMGSGKTSTGLELSAMTGLPLIDTDQMIEEQEGKTISRIFADSGECYFRDLETGLLEKLCGNDKSYVISIGGGMPVREQNRQLLKQLGTVVYLTASDKVLAARLLGDTTRPLLADGDLREKIRSLKAAREENYRNLADLTVDTDGKDPSEAAGMIVSLASLDA